MADKTIALELTQEEGALLWQMLAAKRQMTHPTEIAQELVLAKRIQDKINAAAKAVGFGEGGFGEGGFGG